MLPLGQLVNFETIKTVEPIQRDNGQRRAALMINLATRDMEGYVRRAEDSADRRVKRLSLTAKGRKTIEHLVEIRARDFERALETLTDDERERLARALEPILERRA